MPKWWNIKLIKCHDDEISSWPNDPAPFLFSNKIEEKVLNVEKKIWPGKGKVKIVDYFILFYRLSPI